MNTSTNTDASFAIVIMWLKVAVGGFLLGEVWYVSRTVADSLEVYVAEFDAPLFVLLLCGLSLAAVAGYLLTRGYYNRLVLFVQSRRIDVVVALFAGLFISVSWEGVGTPYYKTFVEPFGPEQLTAIVLFPVVIAALLTLRAIGARFAKGPAEAPFFLNDAEKITNKDDLLEFSEDADRFAERVLNGKSRDSIVFGLDAPWGIGKSTFVNFCKEYWKSKYGGQVIVYTFNLLRYTDRSNPLEKFLDGFVRTIQANIFVPEIRPLVSRYSRLMQPKGFSIFGFSLETLRDSYTIDDAFDDLERVLSRVEKKIIVVIDDLDRLSYAVIKDVLFVIKKSLMLPNVSYVLCYDTENILIQGKRNQDAERVREFLEKFVNVKVSLFLHSSTLSRYISDNFERALQCNLQLDPYTVAQLKKVIGAIVRIYQSEDFHLYQSTLGDIRKLKRLINTLVLFEIEKTDFENSDIDADDLIHLLLIYVNYPAVFRKIYNTETGGKRGFFSVISPLDDEYPGDDSSRDYKNSSNYKKYVRSLPEGQRFLIDKVFSANKRLNNQAIDEIDKIRHSYACFNGDKYGASGRNLEQYLDLIVKLAKPQKRDQYQFYLNAKARILAGASIDEVLADEQFSFSNGESSRQQFWRVVVNTADEFSPQLGSTIINYVLDHIPEYSLLENEILLGLRKDFAYSLIKLLDTLGWQDASGRHRDNSDENVLGIARWIFGEGEYEGNGILHRLGAQDRGVCGLYDLMVFRLYCCADRGGSFFNLQRALAKHGDTNAPTSGPLTTIVISEMREISQSVYRHFKARYQVPQINVFSVIDNLTLRELAGNYYSFIEAKMASGEVTETEVNRAIAIMKSRMKMFITYQLANVRVSSGIGCGYYDEEGNADNKGISVKMNEYLFDICFSPDGGQNNFEYFVDYLLMNLESHPFDDEEQYKPTVEGLTKVLNKALLIKYWIANAPAIRGFDLPSRDKKVVTSNYIASYRDDLNKVYRVLDRLVGCSAKEGDEGSG